MNNFFIPNVSGRKKTKLKAAGIIYAEMEIDDISGLVFEQGHIVNCLQVLKFDISNQIPTSIPGIIRLETVASDIVTFNPEAPEEVEAESDDSRVIISAPEGYKCEHWEPLLKQIGGWAITNLPAIEKIIIHEAYYQTRPRFAALEGELHIVLGRHLGLGGAKKGVADVEYYPMARTICIKIPTCPKEPADFEKIISYIAEYSPIVLATSPEEVEQAEKILPYGISFSNNWDGQLRQTELEKIIRQAWPKSICPGVIVGVPHGMAVRPNTTDELIHIFAWSAPFGDKIATTPEKMWGYRVGCTDGSFPSTETGITIYTTEGYAVAEIVGRNLYIFHDITHKDREDDYKIFQKILEEAASIFKLTDVERQALINSPKVLINNQGNGLSTPDKIKKATEDILLPVLARKIIVHNTGDARANSPNNDGDGVFHIWLYSAASGSANRSNRLPDKLFGFYTNNRDYDWNCFKPAEIGVEIIESESLFAVAELLDNNLYIHIPLGYREMTGGVDIYRRILELTIVELNRTPAEKAERDQAIKEIRRERALKSYVAICQKRQEVATRNQKQELESLTQHVLELQRSLIEKIRREAELKHSLRSLQDRQTATSAEFEAEFNRLFNIEGVESVTAQENKLVVNTHHIYITTQKDKYSPEITFDIGKFRIEIYFNGENGGLLFFNTTRKGKGRENGYNVHHPHVNGNGAPCLGNITGMIAQLIAEYQFAAITALAIQFLETVNLEDAAGKEIFMYWPVAEKSKPEGDA